MWASCSFLNDALSLTSTPVKEQLLHLYGFFKSISFRPLGGKSAFLRAISLLVLHELIILISFNTKSRKGPQCSNELGNEVNGLGSEWGGTVTMQDAEAVVYYSSPVCTPSEMM